MGCSVTARKPAAGASTLELGAKAEVSETSNTNPLAFLLRVLLGSMGGALGGGRAGQGQEPAHPCLFALCAGSKQQSHSCSPLLNMLLYIPTPPHCCSHAASPGCHTAGFWFFVLPIYMWVKNLVWPRTGPLAEKF
jgi:hypothetical protein